MKRSILQTVITALLVLVLVNDIALAENDFALRPELDLTDHLTDDLAWGWKLETTIASHVQSAAGINLLARVSWKPFATLSVTPELVYGSQGGNPEGNEWRPRLGVEGSRSLSSITLALRGRAEYRMKEGQDEYWRYRGRLKLKLPSIAGFKPFIYDEIFYESGVKNELNTNEAGLGGKVDLMEGVSLNLDLRLITSRSDDHWRDPDIHLLSTFEIGF